MTAAALERIANDFGTTLAADIDDSQGSFQVATAAPTELRNGQFRARIGDELVLVKSGQDGTTWVVDRGIEGTTKVAHLGGAAVDHVLTRGAYEALLWRPLIDESGASFANFTPNNGGSWSSDGSKIVQATGNAQNTRARCDTKIQSPLYVVEVEIQIPSAGQTSAADQHAGLLLGYNGGNSTGSCAVRIGGGNNAAPSVFGCEVDFVSARISFTVASAFNTWHKLRAIYSGASCSIFLNGTHYGVAGNVTAHNDSSFVGLLSFNWVTWFRNLKVWVPAGLPGVPA